MVGHVTESTATVWMRVGQPSTQIRATAHQNGNSVEGTPTTLGSLNHILMKFEDLLPGMPTHAQIVVGEEGERPIETHDVFFRTASPPEATGGLRIAFGSCSQDSRRPYAPVYEAMAFEQPDLAIFVGDNTYFIVGDGHWNTSGPIGDWTSAEAMLSRHMRTRTNPYLQRLLRSVPCYAVWDDHDYGPNNSDRTFELRDSALQAFRQVWANPSYGTADTQGIFSNFRRGPVEVFLMDGRYHKWVATDKHPSVSDKDAEIWGEGQLNWLLDGLSRSSAPIKVIANGTQIISKDGRGEGHFNEAPQELNKLLAFLKERKIGGVIFLSGDRHMTEVLRLEQSDGPDILEFTSSPIQQGQAFGVIERDHPTHVWAARGNSYGLLTIEVEGTRDGLIRFEMRDANNYVPKAGDRRMASEFPVSSLMYEEE
jgi:alkaline phosphatase D